MPAKRRYRKTPPPSPIPTGKGSRSAAGPFLSDYIDKSSSVPELTLPQHVRGRELEEISYGLLLFRDKGAVRGFLRLAREQGVFRIGDHGIPTEELRLALAHSDRIFGSAVECLTSYGDHEKLVWRGDDHGREMMEEAAGRAVNIGDDNFQSLWKSMEKLAGKLEEIAAELAEVMDEYLMDTKQSRMVMIITGLMEKPTLSIHRYHRANIIDRISSSVMDETISGDQSGPYGLSLHVLLESGELCVQTDGGKYLLFVTSADTIVVTMGKQIEEWSHGRFKSANGELMFKPYLHSNKPSFSIERKWSSSNSKDVKKIISLANQIMILLILSLFYRSFNCLSLFLSLIPI